MCLQALHVIVLVYGRVRLCDGCVLFLLASLIRVFYFPNEEG